MPLLLLLIFLWLVAYCLWPDLCSFSVHLSRPAVDQWRSVVKGFAVAVALAFDLANCQLLIANC